MTQHPLPLAAYLTKHDMCSIIVVVVSKHLPYARARELKQAIFGIQLSVLCLPYARARELKQHIVVNLAGKRDPPYARARELKQTSLVYSCLYYAFLTRVRAN